MGSGNVADDEIFCTEFNPALRRSARELQSRLIILKEEIKSYEEANMYPLVDEQQKKLFRPIGFNNFTEKVPVNNDLEALLSIPSIDFSTNSSLAEENFDSTKDEYQNQQNNQLTGVQNLADHLETRFENHFRHLRTELKSLDETKRSVFFQTLPTIIEEARANCEIPFGGQYCPKMIHIFDHPEDFGDYFKAILVNDHDEKLDNLQNVFVFDEAWQESFLPSWNYVRISAIIDNFSLYKGNMLTPKLFFRSFISLRTADEWFLVSESEQLFVKADFSRQEKAENWSVESKEVVFSTGEELVFESIRSMNIADVVQTLEQTRGRFISQIQAKMSRYVPLDSSDLKNKQLSNSKIAINAQIPGYVCQLRNPPRQQCLHQKKCSVKYLNPYPLHHQNSLSGTISEKFMIPYYECASKEEQDYLSEWLWLCDELGLKKESYAQFEKTEASELVKFGNSFYFREFLNENHYYILLDHPENYENHEKVPCFDGDFKTHLFSADLIRKSMNEMKKEEQKFLKITRIEGNFPVFRYATQVLDFEGKEVPFDDKYVKESDFLRSKAEIFQSSANKKKANI
ncbi:unnamed protein product, partial [Mesorhabditis belari]|uniref:Uncharacterized protein n=1 Tax=Mesorhabditis belari TaxID=2138241 RepID=A0AAF3EHY5_9BILA